MAEIISSASNPLAKQIRSLRQKKTRDETGLFLVEGIHHVGEAVEAGWEVENLVCAPDLLESGFARSLVEQRSHSGGRCSLLSARLFSELAEKDNPQGILAIVRQRRQSIEELDPSRIRLAAAMVNPQDPGNVGTVLRTLDAVPGQALFILDGGVDLYHPSLVRASMGALFWVPVGRGSFEDFATWAHAHGIELVGSSAHASEDYRHVKPGGKPCILVLGSEQKGLSAAQLQACDRQVSIPMNHRASSLNLAVAAGILLYALAN